MQHEKAFYTGLKLPKGFTWGFYDSAKKLHSFIAQIQGGKYAEVKCRESEISDGSLELLIKMGMTR